MIFDGRNGGTVELLDTILVIRRSGVASFLTQGLKGEKRIPYASVSSVQFKEAGFTTGYIQFGVTGGIESGRGIWDATTDENTVLFVKEAADEFRQLRDIVEERMATARNGPSTPSITSPVNIAEELTRLADLRDRGVLTGEEFAQQKARLLGHAPSAGERELTATPAPTSRTLNANLRAQVSASPEQPPKKRTGWFGRILGFGCLGLIGLLVLLAGIGSQLETQNSSAAVAPSEPGTAAEGGPTSQQSALKVTAVQLARAYSSNEARAQQAYGEQPLLVEGTVSGVDLDLTDEPVVQLATDNEFMPASAHLTEDSKSKASGLNKGQSVELLCENVSEVMSMPQLKDCEIL